MQARGDFAADLRQVIEHEIAHADLNSILLWTYKIGEWVAHLRRHLDLNGIKPARSIRDATCPNCGNTHVRIEAEPTSVHDQPTFVIEPALMVPDPQQPSAYCLVCTRTWPDNQAMIKLAYAIEAIRAAPPRETGA